MKTSSIASSEAAVRTDPCADDYVAGVPEVLWYGVEGDYKCMVMELLG